MNGLFYSMSVEQETNTGTCSEITGKRIFFQLTDKLTFQTNKSFRHAL